MASEFVPENGKEIEATPAAQHAESALVPIRRTSRHHDRTMCGHAIERSIILWLHKTPHLREEAFRRDRTILKELHKKPHLSNGSSDVVLPRTRLKLHTARAWILNFFIQANARWQLRP